MKYLWLAALLFSSYASALADVEQSDKVLIEKASRRLTLFKGQRVLSRYEVSLGFEPVGPKTQEGDGKTPEGSYVIAGRNAKSAFHRSLKISYPDKKDRENAKRLGVSPGGDVMIHGLTNGLRWIGRAHLKRDWTLGCVAVTNEEIEEIWKLVPDGTPVEILP